MRERLAVTLVLALLGTAGLAAAQEAEVETTSDSERPALRVLAHPYDVAAFYRSDPESAAAGDVRRDPYAIAGFYRSGSSAYRPFAPYWSSPRARRWNGWDSGRLRVGPAVAPHPDEPSRPPHVPEEARERR